MKKQITKSYLEYLGITDVTPDGRIFTKNGELKPSLRGPKGGERLSVLLHDSEKYKSVPKEKRNHSSGQVLILVHKAVYAWFHGEIPYTKEVHHVDCDPLNNSITNLEALTHEEHVAKHAAMRAGTIKVYDSTRELKCKLNVPRKWYEEKIVELEKLYKEAKLNRDSEQAHSLRSNMSQMRAKLRYYDSHIEEAQNLAEFKKDLSELQAWKKIFKSQGNLRNWHECCTIEKAVKENGIESWPIVKHALEVAHRHFGGELTNE